VLEQLEEHPLPRLNLLLTSFNAADDVVSVVLLPHHVEGDEGDEAGDLHQEVDGQRHPRVERKRTHRRHVRERAQKEARRF